LQKYLTFLILLTTLFGFSQEQTTLLLGNVKNLNNDVSDILIVNLNSKKSTITDSLGHFKIEVKLKDTLRITAVQYLTREIIISEKIFNTTLVTVNLAENVIDLEEVTVTQHNLSGKIGLDLKRLVITPNITSSTLKLPNADVVKMTQSERLLIEADRGNYVNYYGLALTINTHKIMNKLSGRTEAFEEMVVRDKKMKLEKEIIAKFSKKSMSEGFNIPEIKIDGFLTYCLLQDDFLELSEKRTMEVWEYLKSKSIEYSQTDYSND
jgi:hypothetical protein